MAQTVFTSTGDNYWDIPDGVWKLTSIYLIGGGGKGGDGSNGQGGGGGGGGAVVEILDLALPPTSVNNNHWTFKVGAGSSGGGAEVTAFQNGGQFTFPHTNWATADFGRDGDQFGGAGGFGQAANCTNDVSLANFTASNGGNGGSASSDGGGGGGSSGGGTTAGADGSAATGSTGQGGGVAPSGGGDGGAGGDNGVDGTAGTQPGGGGGGAGTGNTGGAGAPGQAVINYLDPATHLSIDVQPTTTVQNGTISPGVEVRALDASNATNTDYAGDITISVASGPGAIHGTLTVTAVNGVATFSNLSIDTPGTYTLTVTSNDNMASDTSSSFSVTGITINKFESISVSESTTVRTTLNINKSESITVTDRKRAMIPSTVNLLSGLVSYWAFDEASGNALDSFGSNPLTQNGTVGSAAGKISNARVFDNSLSDYFSHADNTDLSVNGTDFTFAGWVYLDDVTHTYMILAKGPVSSGATLEYTLAANGFVGYDFRTSSGSGTVDSVTKTSAATTWQYVVVWHDSSIGQNGVCVNDGTPVLAGAADSVQDGTNSFFFGNDSANNFPLSGKTDEWGFWKRLLTPSEKTALYNSGTGLAYPFGSSDLVVNVNDAIAVSESLFQFTSLTIHGTDTVAVAESTTILDTLRVTVNDSITTSESLSRTLVYLLSVSDAISVAENKTVNLLVMPSVNDSITINENEAIYAPFEQPFPTPDVVTITEFVALQIPFYNLNVNDTVTVTPVATVAPLRLINVHENISVSEHVSRTASTLCSVAVASASAVAVPVDVSLVLVASMPVASVTVAALPVSVVPGACSVTPEVATVLAEGVPVFAAGPVFASLAVGSASAVGVPLVVTSELVLTLGVGLAEANVLPVTVNPGAAMVDLGVTSVAFLGLPLSVVAGLATVSVPVASVTAGGLPVALSAPVAVAVSAASVEASALPVSVIPGSISFSVGTATSDVGAFPVVVAPGTATVLVGVATSAVGAVPVSVLLVDPSVAATSIRSVGFVGGVHAVGGTTGETRIATVSFVAGARAVSGH